MPGPGQDAVQVPVRVPVRVLEPGQDAEQVPGPEQVPVQASIPGGTG